MDILRFAGRMLGHARHEWRLLRPHGILRRESSVSPLLLTLALAISTASVGGQQQRSAVLSTETHPMGTIRGGVYLDRTGSGRCGPGAEAETQPVPDVTVEFWQGNLVVSLYTGDDGTFGLAAASQGEWLVGVDPRQPNWIVTSASPTRVQVGGGGGLVVTDVNFCVQALFAGPAGANAAGTFPSEAVGVNASEMLLTAPQGAAPTTISPDVQVMPANEGAAPAATWLGYLNQFRRAGGVAPLVEDPELTTGSQLHSRYMVVNDRAIAHSESVNNPLYDPLGHQAAKNGNIFATTQLEADYTWGMNFWVSAPFHLVPMLDPKLSAVGYGNYNQAVGTFHMAAVLDVRSKMDAPIENVQYPLAFPTEGATTWVVRHSLYEWPDPLTSCPGYSRPTGAPIVLQLGDGSMTPNVADYSVTVGGEPVPACVFHEGNYYNPESYDQQVGRVILNERDAIVVMPRQPLPIGETVAVSIDANGQSYGWSFQTGAPPK